MTRSAEERTPNRLIHATSPYLLQHAHNPVDWFEWGPEALERAAEEDKPILVSIGYSACHWCHVMERESFEVESIAKIMNEHFVCIKVDREERPDIDQIYMEAVQAMGVHGGWPLNVFLNPSQKPFYGGTYFPPQNWARLLLQINQVFREKRKEVDSTAEDINQSLQVSDLQRFASGAAEEEHHLSDLEKMFQLLDARFDKTWGGIEKSPKFVMPTIWQFLLRYFAATNSGEALDMVSLTLTKMSEAGLYDQLGGGFSRYSVDGEWFAPHFEKMLYDNGQLLGLYAEAFSATSNPLFRAIVSETIGWLEREMKSPEGGLYSALDADSEGVEGKFYTWTYPEWTAALAELAPSAAKYFGVSVSGNWEHERNILRRVTYEPLKDELLIRERLLKTRHHRIRPGLDDKMLTAWNAMAVYGLTSAYRTFGEPAYLSLAQDVIQFIESKAIAGGKVYRSFKGHRSVTEGFLEDYAFLIQAYTSLYQCTFSEHYLDQAKHWCSYTIDNFFDKKEGYFYFAGSAGESLIARKKEVFDNVIPSSNSVMARNLFTLGTLLDHAPWIRQAREMVSRLKAIILSEPGYASHWGLLLAEMTIGMKEVVIVGPDAERKRMELCKHFLPFCLILGATKKSDLPLLQGRDGRDEKTRIYVCINKTCQLPVETVEEALQQINSLHP